MSEFRSGEILDAARKVFALKGFNLATMEDVAEEAGLAKGTLYLYFRSKREMFVETLRSGILDLHERTCSRMQEAGTAAEKIRAFLDIRIRYFDDNRDFFKIYFSEFDPLRVRDEFRDLYVRQARILEEALAHGVRTGELPAMRTDAAALTIYAAARGFIAQRVMGWVEGDVDGDAEFLFGMIWNGVSRQ